MIMIVVETVIQMLIIVMMCIVVSQHVEFEFRTRLMDSEQYFKIELANVAFGVVAVLITLMTSCQRIPAH